MVDCWQLQWGLAVGGVRRGTVTVVMRHELFEGLSQAALSQNEAFFHVRLT